MKIFKNVLIFIFSSLASFFLSSFVGDWYGELFGGGSWIDVSSIIGFPLAYVFFLTLLFTAFGGGKKYWWIGILLIPAAMFELYFDAAHIYFPIGLALLGWLLGFVFHRLVKK